ncbi:endolytic transglycosylase MltG [Alkaliphilus pronyensis]|uniref:Endolytic transglycosylase MltG n=1 Tax=Alkaliphilus pronyensis TaxID=1482732 RepID=A0A6I0FBH9_9FIRM|nr:hypothetical protein [Alkaliphilus pronyensis]KAB3534850.1 endolytic transglycosylase MltG [Alkaliphilus pronyensis]
MEKLKDLIHDFTDILLALVIVAVMIAVVTYNLGDWFEFDKDVNAAQIPDAIEADTPNNPVVIADDSEEASQENHEEDMEENTDEVVDEENTEEEIVEDEASSPITVVEVKEIVIPNGTPGVGVAKILQENGLIENTSDFIKAAEELQLDIKLKSGTFFIPTSASIEDMVKTIAKVN